VSCSKGLDQQLLGRLLQQSGADDDDDGAVMRKLTHQYEISSV